ncbi:MAG: hypothetical protein R2856_30915 [Caldilineaceae bacterium]
MPTHMPPITVTAVDAESSDELVAEGWMLNEGFTGVWRWRPPTM